MGFKPGETQAEIYHCYYTKGLEGLLLYLCRENKDSYDKVPF